MFLEGALEAVSISFFGEMELKLERVLFKRGFLKIYRGGYSDSNYGKLTPLYINFFSTEGL